MLLIRCLGKVFDTDDNISRNQFIQYLDGRTLTKNKPNMYLGNYHSVLLVENLNNLDKII